MLETQSIDTGLVRKSFLTLSLKDIVPLVGDFKSQMSQLRNPISRHLPNKSNIIKQILRSWIVYNVEVQMKLVIRIMRMLIIQDRVWEIQL